MKKWIEKIDKWHDILFFGAYALLLVAGTLRQTFFAAYIEYHYTYIFIIGFGILALSELLELMAGKYQLRDWVGVIVCGTLFLILFRMIGDSLEFSSFLPLMFVARNVDFDKIARFTIYIQGILLAMVILLGLSGNIQNVWELQYDELGIMGEKSRNMCFVGTLYHLYPGNFFINLTMMTLYVNRKKKKTINMILLASINILLYILAAGRTTYIVTFMLIVFAWIYSINEEIVTNRLSKKMGRVLPMVFPMTVVGSYCAVLLFNSDVDWMYKVDEAITWRFSYAQQAIEKFGITLLGQHVELFGGGINADGMGASGAYLWIDNAWLSMLVRYGVIVTGMVCLLFMLLMVRLWKKQEYLLMWLIILFEIQMCMDDSNIYFFYNTVLIMLGHVFANDYKNENLRKC